MEYGLLAAHLFSRKAQKLSETRLVTEEELEYVMKKGEILFDDVMSGSIVMTYFEDYKELLRGVVNDVLEKFSFFHINQDNEADVTDTQDNSSTYSANTKADARTAQVRGGRKPLGRRNGNLISILTYLRPKYIKSKYIK